MEWLLNSQALAIVFGGTLLASVLIWRSSLVKIAHAIWHHLTKPRKPDNTHLVGDLILISRLFPLRSSETENLIERTKHPFVKEAFTLLAEGVLDEKAVDRILKGRAHTRHASFLEQVERLRAMSRLPVTFGLISALFFTLEGQTSAVVASMIYALCLSHLFLLPLADWLQEKVEAERSIWIMIAESARLTYLRTNPVVVTEELNSYLVPQQRVRWTAPLVAAKKKAS